MNFDEDGAYDLDLDSFLGIPPMPGTLRGCQHVQRDGWSDQVREPGGLRLDEIQVLGERAAVPASRAAPAAAGLRGFCAFCVSSFTPCFPTVIGANPAVYSSVSS